ncbi:MAG: glycosyltransferase [Clostridia bacterium]|nr:glycosyltransferase [Clostridia bacterium]
MEILYVSSVPSPKEFDRIKEQVKEGVLLTTYGMNESGFKFHTLIMNGMVAEQENRILSLVGRSVSRSTHKGLFWKKRVEKEGNIEHRHLGFINFPGIKQLGIGLSFFFHTLAWQIRNRGKEKGIVMDAAYITVLPFVLAASKPFRCKKTAIYCDIYEYMAEVKDARNNDEISAVRKLARKITMNSYRQLDSYVFLTEQMNEVINPTGKPYIVMEGLVDIHMKAKENILEEKAPGKVVMYAGALREAYGLKNLIEGFRAYEDPEAVLWIFGDGDYAEEIKRLAEEEPRLRFFGAVPLQRVVEEELKATVMVNPRPADREFTKYSFPSKNMEYMVSGTPILTTRLPGMPQEYYDYIFTIDGAEAKDITAALGKALGLSKEQLHQMGQKAKEFVLTKKNNKVQAERIISLLK